MQGCAFIDSKFVELADAKISLFDWGFLHSDATYDVVHVHKGAFFRLDCHLNRFQNSMEKLRLSIPYNKQQIQSILTDCVTKSGLRDSYVEMIATRGFPKVGSRDPRECTNQFYAFAIPYISITKEDEGLHLIISQQQRIPPACIDPKIKNYHWLDMVMGQFEAYEKGGQNAVLVDDKGFIKEGPGFNIFIITNQTLSTPESGVLSGITRQTAMEISHTIGLEVKQQAITANDCYNADEIFITSTAGGIMPVIKIDEQSIGNGQRGKITQQLQQHYWQLHQKSHYRINIDYDSTIT